MKLKKTNFFIGHSYNTRLHLEYFNQEIFISVYKILQTSFSISSIFLRTCATV